MNKPHQLESLAPVVAATGDLDAGIRCQPRDAIISPARGRGRPAISAGILSCGESLRYSG